jgi:hypothetical protein
MNMDRISMVEAVQGLIAETIARHPAGHRLCMIGGYRYRLLSRSCRVSADIDYHWEGDLAAKRDEIAALLARRLPGEVRRRFGYETEVGRATGPEADSPGVRTANVVLYRTGVAPDRLVIPVEVTSIPCADRPVVRTVGGAVYLTASDADLAESKLMALFGRPCVAARDFVDLFLFREHLARDASLRLRRKWPKLGLAPETRSEQFARLLRNRAAHVRAIDAVLDEQVEEPAAANLRAAGGGATIFDAAMELLAAHVAPRGGARR